MANSEILQRELGFIQDNKLRDFISYVLNDLPDYFRKIGASTSGKYHPIYTIGEEGLIRHTQAAVAIAQDLFRADFYKFNSNQKDIVISALILHDGLKCGMWEDHTAFDHPLLMRDFIDDKYIEYAKKYNIDVDIFKEIDFHNRVSEIGDCVASHMGKWNTLQRYCETDLEDKDYITLPLPETDMQKCVHLCDYLASRKHLIFDFKVYDEELSENKESQVKDESYKRNK